MHTFTHASWSWLSVGETLQFDKFISFYKVQNRSGVKYKKGFACIGNLSKDGMSRGMLTLLM